jgi:uncharacterized protein (DUF58 family)
MGTEAVKELSKALRDFEYSIDWRSAVLRAGRHRSRRSGSGFEFRGVMPVTQAPQSKRIDIRSTLLAPDGIPRVRVFEEKSSVKVILVVDLSASVAYGNRQWEMANLACIVAYSAYRTGDMFGYIGYGEKIECYESPVFSKEAVFDIGLLLWNHEFRAKNHQGLSEVAAYLPNERSLIFWFSDFHLPERDIAAFLEETKAHDVRAVAFWDNAEFNLPSFGFVRFRDAESAAERLIFMRPAIKRKLEREFADKRKKLVRLFGDADIHFHIGRQNLNAFQKWLLK